MAAATLPAPGSKVGPCKTDCMHRDCATTRAMAQTPCAHCRKAIGYDCWFYQIGPSPADEHGNPSSWRDLLAHASCHEQCREDAEHIAYLLDGRRLAFIALQPNSRAALLEALSDVVGYVKDDTDLRRAIGEIIARLRGAP